MRTIYSAVAGAVLCLSGPAEPLHAADAPPQVIILKLDDITQHGGGAAPISPRWQRVTDYLDKLHIKASYGIIGYSLERDNAAYFDWIKALHAKGTVEFWNHGYRERKPEDKSGEFEGPLDQQRAALLRTQTLAREKLGLELKAFGPHWSGTNGDTAKALDAIPELTMWFYGPPESKKYVFPRVLTLENPTFVPDFDKFKALYERAAHDKPVLALQGHPNQWTDPRWEGFVKIIDFLRSRNCVFMTPSEWLATVRK